MGGQISKDSPELSSLIPISLLGTTSLQQDLEVGPRFMEGGASALRSTCGLSGSKEAAPGVSGELRLEEETPTGITGSLVQSPAPRAVVCYEFIQFSP